MTGPSPVLIVGAGPVGLVLGCELLRRDVPVRLIDADRRFTRHSRANVLWPRILELLDGIGVTDRLVPIGHRIGGVGYYSSGRPIGTVRVDDEDRSRYPFALVISQNTTEDVLRERFTELGGVLETDTRLTGMDLSGANPVAELTTSHGVTLVEAGWIVGADGAHSRTRELAGITFDDGLVDVSFAVADATVSGMPDETLTYYCYSRRGGLALGPFGAGVWRLAITVPHSTTGEAPGTETFQRALDDRAPGAPVIGELQWSAVFRARCRIATRFRTGRCLLVGDAAHVTSPAGGQGMNTGIQDAVNLGWRLAGVLKGTLHEDVLDHYDDERRGAAHAVADATTKQTRWGMASGRGAVAVRDTLFRAAYRSGLLRSRVAPILTQLGVRYRGPAESTDPRAGRALPLRLGTGREWLSAERLTLLAWPGYRTSGPRARDRWPVSASDAERTVWANPDAASLASLRPRLGRRPGLVVVRPDGHIVTVLRHRDPLLLRRVLDRAVPLPAPDHLDGGSRVPPTRPPSGALP